MFSSTALPSLFLPPLLPWPVLRDYIISFLWYLAEHNKFSSLSSIYLLSQFLEVRKHGTGKLGSLFVIVQTAESKMSAVAAILIWGSGSSSKLFVGRINFLVWPKSPFSWLLNRDHCQFLAICPQGPFTAWLFGFIQETRSQFPYFLCPWPLDFPIGTFWKNLAD